jgi:NADPH:quinone reductase-like Zn-dependent oxidoreductase
MGEAQIPGFASASGKSKTRDWRVAAQDFVAAPLLDSPAMRAVGLYRYLPIADPESLLDVEVPTPEARGRDLRVRVKAVSVNPVDTKVRSPKEAVETEPRILGWDAAGVVEAVGEGVSLFSPGDEVYYAGSIVRPGCDSELHLVDERIVGRKPRNLSFEEAAAMPLTTLTAWEVMFDRMAVPRGARIREHDRQGGALRDGITGAVILRPWTSNPSPAAI